MQTAGDRSAAAGYAAHEQLQVFMRSLQLRGARRIRLRGPQAVLMIVGRDRRAVVILIVIGLTLDAAQVRDRIEQEA